MTIGDGCDDYFDSGGGTENTVTIVTTVTEQLHVTITAKCQLDTLRCVPTPRIPRPRWYIRKCIIGWQSGFFKICSAGERQDWSKQCAKMLPVTLWHLQSVYHLQATAEASAEAALPRSPSESAMLF